VLLADIATGKTDIAEVMFLVALILFVVAGVVSVMTRAIWSALLCFGLAFVAFGWFLL
jgi:hypothetical protein